MNYLTLIAVIGVGFILLFGYQGYRYYSIWKEWGHGEVVVKWISPDEYKMIYLMLLMMLALVAAVVTRSEALLSSLWALLIGFGGMISQFTFLNIIGKRGIFLGRSKLGIEWDQIERLAFVQGTNRYSLEIGVVSQNGSEKRNVFRRIQDELESIQNFESPASEEEQHTDGEKESRASGGFEATEKFKKREERNPKDKGTTVKPQLVTHKIRFGEKHQFNVQQALMYYFPQAMEYRKEKE